MEGKVPEERQLIKIEEVSLERMSLVLHSEAIVEPVLLLSGKIPKSLGDFRKRQHQLSWLDIPSKKEDIPCVSHLSKRDIHRVG